MHATRRGSGVTRYGQKLKEWTPPTCPPSIHFFSSRPAAGLMLHAAALQRLQLVSPISFSISPREVLWEIEVVFVASD